MMTTEKIWQALIDHKHIRVAHQYKYEENVSEFLKINQSNIFFKQSLINAFF